MYPANKHSLLRTLVSCAIAVIAFGSSSALSSEVYSYTGPNYSAVDCSGTYVANCLSDHLSGSFTTNLSLSQLENLTSDPIPVSDITSFSFSDGNGLTLTQANASVTSLGITTDALGDIDWWVISFLGSGFINTQSCIPGTCPGGFTGGLDSSGFSGANSGATSYDPLGQSWSAPQFAASTPEASGGLLVGIGLTLMAAFTTIRRRQLTAKARAI